MTEAMVLYMTVQQCDVNFFMAREADLTEEHMAWLETTLPDGEYDEDDTDAAYGFLTWAMRAARCDDLSEVEKASFAAKREKYGRDEASRIFAPVEYPCLNANQVITKVFHQAFTASCEYADSDSL